MPKTIQIRDVDDEVYAGLVRRAAEAGMTVPELLRTEAARIASRPSVATWLERTRRRTSQIERAEVLAALDEHRGPWPVLVVDAACLFEVLAGTTRAEPIRQRLALDEDHAAPHIIDVEVFGVIRREHRLGRLDRTAAEQAVQDLETWPGERFGHAWLLSRAWELRDAVRGWDAMYVALAEALDTVLLTLDARLAAARGPTCRIELLP